MCLRLDGLSFGGRQTCLLVVVFMRSDFFHRVVLGFDVDDIFISDVIMVHGLSSELMVALIFSRRLLCHLLARHMANMLCCACDTRLLLPPLVLTILRATDNQQQLRFQQLAVRCFPMRLCQHLRRYSLHIGGTWFAMSSDARICPSHLALHIGLEDMFGL